MVNSGNISDNVCKQLSLINCTYNLRWPGSTDLLEGDSSVGGGGHGGLVFAQDDLYGGGTCHGVDAVGRRHHVPVVEQRPTTERHRATRCDQSRLATQHNIALAARVDDGSGIPMYICMYQASRKNGYYCFRS